jgi:hypothetical protein
LIGAGIGLGLAGLGYLIYQGYQQRTEFKAGLSRRLREFGIDLVTADVGRSESGAPIWHVTVRHPVRGIQAFVAAFPPTADPYSESTLDELAPRLLGYFGYRA